MDKPDKKASVLRIIALAFTVPISLLFSSCAYMAKIHPEVIKSVLINPMTGFAPWASAPELVTDRHTLVYVDLTWRDWEPKPGVYDYEGFEENSSLPRWREEGKRVVFRFVCDKPGDDKHMDIPDWLYEQTKGNGDWYDTSYGMGYAPDYSNPYFIERHKMAVKALAERYGRDDFFCFIELGSLGHWGEWHVKYNSGIREMPKTSIREQYVRHYIEAFPNTHLMMRRPFAIAANEGLGVYNDMTGDKESTEEWLSWIANGGDYSQASEGKGALLAMPDGWKSAPVGGEFTSGKPMKLILKDDIDITLDLLKRSHTTFIGPKTPIDERNGSHYTDGIEKILTTIGYRIRIKEAIFSTLIFNSNQLHVSLEWVNDGIAPFYYNWEVFLFVFDSNGNEVLKERVNAELTKVIPNSSYITKTRINIKELKGKKGAYDIGLAIIDPLTNLPGISLAMKNKRNDKIYILGSYTIK